MRSLVAGVSPLLDLSVPRTHPTRSGSHPVLVDVAAQAVRSSEPGRVDLHDRHMRRVEPSRCPLVDRAVRAVGIVVLGEYDLQVTTAEDEHPVEARASNGAEHALADGVGPRCPHRGLDDAGALGGEDGVKGSRELGVAIAHVELDLACLFGNLHREVARLVGHPV